MSTPTFGLNIQFVPAEPDGSECFQCGDPVYLKGWKLRFTLASTGALLCESERQACDSCVGDELRRLKG